MKNTERSLTLAFALFRYFPYGGLQRDMLRIASACAARGANIVIFCAEWEGDVPANMRVQQLSVTGITNHSRHRSFSQALQRAVVKLQPDLVVGFNKMPHIDMYYAADTCFKAKLMQERLPQLRFLPRYRQYLRDEKAVFGKDSATKILAIAQRSVDEYAQYYPNVATRCTVLPPGINPDRRAGANANELRKAFRQQWSLQDDEHLVLMVGSGFRTKGVDRAIRALAALPAQILSCTRLMIVGQDKPNTFLRLAKQLGVEKQLQFLSGRDDIPQFLLGADVLIHPAYRENTGTVLLEAAVAGLPVLTTSVCGYSHYLRDYDCGMVIDEPFSQAALNDALAMMLRDDAQRMRWKENALRMAETADIYSLFERAADAIVETARQRKP
jgi:UDP-glucose:(heptosyl)LPS alpha-1,3-glucosyltransferase